MRRPAVTPTVALLFRLPFRLKTKLDLYLYSPLEGRVPYGSHSRLICKLLEDFLATVESKDDPLD